VRTAPVDFPDLLASPSLPIAAKLEAFYAGQWLGEIPFDDASIVWDDGSLVAGTLKFTAPDPDAWWVAPPLAVRWIDHGSQDETPAITDTPLGTDGHKIRVSYGIRREGGRDIAWVPIGWFRISDAVPDGGYVNVTAPDLMDAVQRARFVVPKSYPTGYAYLFVVDQLVYPLVPDYITDNGPGSIAFKAMPQKSWDRERLDALQEVIDSMPGVAHLDSSGTLVVDKAEYVPPLGDVLKSGPNGNAVSVRKVANPDAGFNACVVIGRDSNGQDIMGVAYIVSGPRRWDGPYGRNPGFYASEMLTTKDQCRQVASATLQRWQRRQAEVWRVTMAPDPRLELRDRRPIVYDPSGIGDARVGVCTHVELKLTADGGAMVADFAMES
jgi:hypothetical protein